MPEKFDDMDDPFQKLICDALDHARAQPPQSWVFTTPDEAIFFASSREKTAESSRAPSARTSPANRTEVNLRVGGAKQSPIKESQPRIEKSEEPDRSDRIASCPNPPSGRSIKPDLNLSEELIKALKKVAPGIQIVEQAPDDSVAKRVASAWKERLDGIDVVLLVLSHHPEMLELMKNLAKAIQKDLGPVKLMLGDRLEQEKRWDLFFQANTLRLILVSPGIENYPELLKHYKAVPAQQSAFLASVPLIVLEDAVVYRHAPDKKIGLWKSLCLILQK